MPDLVITVIAAPPALPCSASKLAVLTLTVSTVSAGDTYMTWCGSQMLTFVAPSVFVALVLGFCPLTNVRSDRPGVSTSLFWKVAGVAPGIRLSSDW